MKKLWLSIGIVLMVILSVIVVITYLNRTPSVIKIGHIAPLTGDDAIWGRWEDEGINLAVQEINMRGGILGRKIEIIDEDDRGDPQVAVSALQKLITVNGVQAVIGATLSSPTLACAPIANQNKVVMISPSAQSPKLSEAGPYVFKLFVSSAIEGKHLVEVAERYHVQRVAIMYLNNDYGLGLEEVINNLLSTNGVRVVDTESYNSQESDFRTQISRIQSESPDAMFLLGYPTDMGLILVQAKQLGLHVRIFAPDSFEAEDILKTADGAANGVIYVYPILPSSDLYARVDSEFYSKYQRHMNIYNGMGFDAIQILSQAIEQSVKATGKIDGQDIKNALHGIKDFPGVTGPISFDANGWVLDRPMEARIVINGKFTTLK